MKVEVVYVYPNISGNGYGAYAERFLASYLQNPPLIDHVTTVVCNGAPPDTDTKGLFSCLPNVTFLTGSNAAYDISAYQEASERSQADIIVFFGASSYVRKPGWLLRMASAFQRHGDGQYGCMANRGSGAVHPHLRTTAFWTTPKLFNNYPNKITNPNQRHPFEHGPNCFTSFIDRIGLKNWLVTAVGEYLWAQWDEAPGGIHSGSQENLLCGDRLSEPPYHWCQ
jgi:hypothetical protein